MVKKSKRKKIRYLITEKISSQIKSELYKLLHFGFSNYELKNLHLKFKDSKDGQRIAVDRKHVHLVRALLNILNVQTMTIVHSL